MNQAENLTASSMKNIVTSTISVTMANSWNCYAKTVLSMTPKRKHVIYPSPSTAETVQNCVNDNELIIKIKNAKSISKSNYIFRWCRTNSALSKEERHVPCGRKLWSILSLHWRHRVIDQMSYWCYFWACTRSLCSCWPDKAEGLQCLS